MRIALLTVTLFTLATAVVPSPSAHAQTTGSTVDGYSEPGGSIMSDVGGVPPGTRGGTPDQGGIDAGPGDRAAGGPAIPPSGDVLPESASGAAPSAATPPAADGTSEASGGTGALTPVPPAPSGNDQGSGGGGSNDGGGEDRERPQAFGDGAHGSAGGEQGGPGVVSPGSIGFGIGARDVALVLVASCMLLLIGVGLGSLARLERTL